MQKLLLCLLSSFVLSCGPGASSASHQLTPHELRVDALHFVQRTQLLGADGTAKSSSGGFASQLYESSGFWPATPLVLPAHAAVFLNENYGAAHGFSYQNFDFAATGCRADQAFARYFAAIETLRAGALSTDEKSRIRGAFSEVFTKKDAKDLEQGLCLFYDLIACVADYAVHNVAVLRQAAASGNSEAIFTGAASCVAEVGGTKAHTPMEFIQ